VSYLRAATFNGNSGDPEGLSQVVQRIDAEAPMRYLTTADLDELSTTAAHRYRSLENRFEESINTSALQTIPLLGSRK